MYIIILIYLIILIIQYYYIRKLNKNSYDNTILEQINYNNKNSKYLESEFNNVISERINLLNTKFKDDYTGWLEYNNNNVLIKIGKYKYYISIFEKIGHTDKFLFKVFPDKSYINLTLDNIISNNNNYTYFSNYNIDKDLLKNMYYNNSNNNIIKSTWIKPIDNILEDKISVYKNFESSNKNNKGIVTIGYISNDINITESYYYYNKLNKYVLIITSLFIFFLSITIYNISKIFVNKIKSILFLVFTNIYILYYISNKEQVGTVNSEIDKQKSLIDSALAVSFLFAVNIYIIQTMYAKYKKSIIYLESTILFIISVILILFTILKDNNFTNIDVLIKKRIHKQYFFNLSIVINIFILINYLVFVILER
jgi:hypothetical protein